MQELILFALLHDGAREVELLDSLMARALALETDGSGGLSNKDQEDISILYLEVLTFSHILISTNLMCFLT